MKLYVIFSIIIQGVSVYNKVLRQIFCYLNESKNLNSDKIYYITKIVKKKHFLPANFLLNPAENQTMT